MGHPFFLLIAGHPAATVLILGQLQAVLVESGLAAVGTILLDLVLRGQGLRFRVAEAAENLGIDLKAHGEEAYAERVGSPQLQ